MRRKPPMVPRHPPRPRRWTSPPGGGCQTASRRAGMVCDVLHPYIPYYNRAVALSCAASGVALVSGICAGRPGACVRSSVLQAVLYPLLLVWYRGRLSGHNRRKSQCKVLCTALFRWRYKCINGTKRAVNACMGLYCNGAKIKALHRVGCKAKEKPGQK